MSFPEFEGLPDSARLWIYAAERDLAAEEVQRIDAEVRAFIDREWASHERKITGASVIRENRFLLVAADESLFTLSGCSMDALRHFIEAIEKNIGVALASSPPIVWRDNGSIRCAERAAFKTIAAGGTISAETVVFNNIIESLGELRAGKWEIPLAESWHARAFPVA